MPSRGRAFSPGKKPLRILLKEIDDAVERYIRNGRDYVTGKNFLRRPPTLMELLEELEAYHHPLSWRARLKGRSVLKRVASHGDNCVCSDLLEDRIRSAFQLTNQRPRNKGAVRRDLNRIGQAVAEPFIAVREGVAVAVTVVTEMAKAMRQKGKQ